MAAMHLIKEQALLRQACYINGQWGVAGNGLTFDVTNPASGEVLAVMPDCGVIETQQAISAAEAALPLWRGMKASDRSRILRRWYELMIEHQDDLALIMTLEQGKPLVEAKGEIIYAASFLEWFAEEAKRIYGETIPSPFANRKIVVQREPVGVCAAITPWNFPSAMITRKVGPALAAGCTMVLKPAEQTPLSALALAVLAEQAGVPAGVFNVLTGEAAIIGDVMTSSPIVRKLSFTGSTAVGRLLMAQCAPSIKKLSLELGGNAPFIVFDDADVDAAVVGAMASKFRNAGQTCVCSNRFLVQAGVYAEFSEKLSDAVAKLKVGNGLDTGVTQGPLIDLAAIEKIEALVGDATAKGASLVCGGKRHALGRTWYEPTILSGVTGDMHLAQEEIFGPIAPLFKFETEAEVITMANATDYGLAAYFYSRDIGRVWRVSDALDYGMVGINTGVISTEVAPFGGVKSSGLGREGSHHGIEDYTEIKYLCIGY